MNIINVIAEFNPYRFVATKLYKYIAFPARQRALQNKLVPLIKRGSKVLDVGCAEGELSKALADKGKFRIEGVDVYFRRKSVIKAKKYNGKKLPYKNKSLDCVLFVDVLHHANNIEQLLKEAKRIGKNIVIKDHYYGNFIEHLALRAYDDLGNRPFGVKVIYNYQTLEQWIGMFKRLKLKVEHAEEGFRIYGPVGIQRHVVFKLKC